jgi:hypothetical protein
MAAVLMVACNTNAVDPREKVIGAYDYVSGGQLNFSFMQEKFDMAKKLIKFWSENPKDTNAVFFFNECRKHGVEVEP